MFARFLAEYSPDSDLKPGAHDVGRPSELRQNLGGSSFAGGVYRMHTLELTDIDVYLEVMGQVLQQVRGLPPGTPIGGATIGD